MYGISGKCLLWIRSYLTIRRQSVAIANHISPTKEFHHSVQQGSVLVCILFVLYIQPLSILIKRHSLSVHLFADDIQIETTILTQNVLSAISSVEICISDVKYWIIAKKLQLNDEKKECLLIRPNKCTQSINYTTLSHLDTMSYISFSTAAINH